MTHFATQFSLSARWSAATRKVTLARKGGRRALEGAPGTGAAREGAAGRRGAGSSSRRQQPPPTPTALSAPDRVLVATLDGTAGPTCWAVSPGQCGAWPQWEDTGPRVPSLGPLGLPFVLPPSLLPPSSLFCVLSQLRPARDFTEVTCP